MSGFELGANRIVWDHGSVEDAVFPDGGGSLSPEDANAILDEVWNNCNLREVTRDAARRLGYDPQ